jgi:hypothetical protein
MRLRGRARHLCNANGAAPRFQRGEIGKRSSDVDADA